jgi:ADP-ribose pyrophosphatase
MKHTKWKILKHEDVSPSKWFPVVKDLVELPNGKTLDYFKAQLPNVAMVVAITKEKEFIFVRQYKHGIGEICMEFPAGRIEEGKTAKQAAVSELAEETGIKVNEDQLIELVELWTEPSKSTVRVTGFLVRDVEINSEQNLEETEQIEIVKVPIRNLDILLKNGELHASDTLALIGYIKMKFPEIFN